MLRSLFLLIYFQIHKLITPKMAGGSVVKKNLPAVQETQEMWV